MAKKVVYNGVEVIEGWPERIQEAQEFHEWSISILRWPLRRVDHKELDLPSGRFNPESKLLFQREEEVLPLFLT